MKEIRLQLKKSGITNLVLGSLMLVLGLWLTLQLRDSMSTGIVLGLCVSLFGISFMILAIKSMGINPCSIRYGGKTLEMPRNAASSEIISFNVDERVEYSIKSYISPSVKVLEVRSNSEVASISYDAFENKSEAELLLKFIRENQG